MFFPQIKNPFTSSQFETVKVIAIEQNDFLIKNYFFELFKKKVMKKKFGLNETEKCLSLLTKLTGHLNVRKCRF